VDEKKTKYTALTNKNKNKTKELYIHNRERMIEINATRADTTPTRLEPDETQIRLCPSATTCWFNGHDLQVAEPG
jgi:hypothetical protein